MKITPTGTLKGVAFVGLGLATIISLRALAQSPAANLAASEPDRDFVLKIKKEHAYKTTEKAFDDALDSLSSDAIYQIKKKASDGKEQMKESKSVSLKTEKVTTSNLAERGSTEELVAIGAHVTIQVASKDVGDITKVLEQLK